MRKSVSEGSKLKVGVFHDAHNSEKESGVWIFAASEPASTNAMDGYAPATRQAGAGTWDRTQEPTHPRYASQIPTKSKASEPNLRTGNAGWVIDLPIQRESRTALLLVGFVVD